MSSPVPRVTVPCALFPPYPLISLPFWMIHGCTPSQPFPQGPDVGGEQGTAKKQAPVTPQRMEGPEGHVAFVPHLGDNASFAVLSHREHLASKLLMLSFAVVAKPQMALETSCCEGCTYFSQLPKNRAQCGEATAPALPNKPLLPESRRKGAEHPVPSPTLGQVPKAALPARGAGACAHQNLSETPRRGSAFSCWERRGEEWGKAKPREAAGLPVPALPPTAHSDGWVGRVPTSPLHLSFLPSCSVGTKRQTGLRVQHLWDTQTKQKPREDREDAAVPLPTVGLSPWQPRLQLAPSTCWAPQTSPATTQSCPSRATSALTPPQESLATEWDMPMDQGIVSPRRFHSF